MREETMLQKCSILWWYKKLSITEPEFHHLSRSRIYEIIGNKVCRGADTTYRAISSPLAHNKRLMDIIEQTIDEPHPPQKLALFYGENNKRE